MLTHLGTMMIWMKQIKRKTREAQATYAPNLVSTCFEYCIKEANIRRPSQSVTMRDTYFKNDRKTNYTDGG